VNRRTSIVALVALAAIALGAVLVATRTDPSSITKLDSVDSASDLPVLSDDPRPALAAEGWLNSKPLAPDDLAGKVVIYDFWTYSCVNCVRTLPHLRAWYERYAADGLVIVGVHSPEFDFEKDHDNVARAVNELGVTWPIALDDDMAIWNAFGNQYWPAKYVTDRKGRLRYVHPGEGAYDETEDVLRVLLGVARSSPRAGESPTSDDPPTTRQTPETYLGSLRGATSTAQHLVDGTADLKAPDPLAQDSFGLDGRWKITPEYAESVGMGDAVVLRFQAAEVNLVMESADGEPLPVTVELDGRPLPASALADGISTSSGRTSVQVQTADLYGLIKDGPSGAHTLRLIASRPGLRAYAFTFGG
jgi:thiol-disulfide isomerase/thioredoxin